MKWRDHALEWISAVAVFVGTLLVLHAIERQAHPGEASPPASRAPLSPSADPADPAHAEPSLTG